MPGIPRIRVLENDGSIRNIVTASSDDDFLANIISEFKKEQADTSSIVVALERLSAERDADIENICTSSHQDFVRSIKTLDHARGDACSLSSDILSLATQYQESTEKLTSQKKNLVDSKNVRKNVTDSAEALKECLEVLRLANQVHDLVAKQNHYAALRALDELQNLLQLRESAKYKIGELIEKSILATQNMIAEAVMADLNTWLYRIRDVSQYIGEVAFYATEQRRQRQKERMAKDQYLGSFKLNSPIELVADELEEFDVLNNEEAQVQVDFSPLYECIHIHDALGQNDRFRTEYANTRRRQKDLTIPSQLRLDDEEAAELKTLLENIAGFVIVERATLKRTENLRSQVDVDELWDSMCQSSTTLITNAVQNLNNADILLKITGVMSLFIQTMESFQFYNSSINALFLTLFERYAQLLRDRCSDDFEEIIATDDYMPMPVTNLEDYDKIIDVGWYKPEKERHEVTFPTVLPFSQMYPMACIDIRTYLNQVYTGPDDYLQKSHVVDETIRKSLNDLLSSSICQPLINRLSTQYPGQIVQILTNLEHFERACEELQVELAEFRTSRSKSGPVKLPVIEKFQDARRQAEKRIFELVNSKIDELIETAEYDWTSRAPVKEPSNYMTELTRYVSNIMSQVLLGLPTEIKELIYFGALSHAAQKILALPLESTVTSIMPSSLKRLQLDVSHLTDFVNSLSLPKQRSSPRPGEEGQGEPQDHPTILKQLLDELTQTVALMTSDDPEEFFDIGQRNKKYSSVNPQNGALVLEKVERGRTEMGIGTTGDGLDQQTDTDSKTKGSDRFGSVMRGLRRAGDTSSGNT